MRRQHLAPHNRLNARELRKKAGLPDETNDCTVRAYSVALRIPYARAHALIKALAKRPDKDGPSAYHFRDFMLRMRFAYHKYEPSYYRVEKSFGSILRQKRITFKRWLCKHGKGVYIVDMSRHVFAVINGTIHDDLAVGPRTVIHGHWRIR